MLVEGSRLGPYEIVSRIGAGGMGEVWRARDTRLERNVAVKILPAELASNAQFKLRFEREAKTVSQLNHPNICTLHDVGHENGVDYLVMELVEGETLADRIGRGPLPLQEAVRYGAEIADALDRAHRAGVIHRDLKPGNVMLTRSGAKLLDFGLAKNSGVLSTASIGSAVAGDGATALRSDRPLTEQGTLLGTFQYMSPEQLEGNEADARSDIFALGAVLYEMVTARRAFEGKTRTSLIAAIIDRDPPPIAAVQPLAPPALERVIRTCLAKNPDERWQSAHDVAAELRWISEVGSQAGVAAPVVIRRKRREVAAWVTAAAGVTLAALLGIEIYRNRNEIAEPIHASILPPRGFGFASTGGSAAISPDGTRVAFVALTETGEEALWVRPVRSSSGQVLAGTTDASYPFWSPDGRQLAYFSGGKLKRISASGGPPQTICEAPSGRGGTWGPNNTILFALVRDSIYQVSAAGGTPVKITNFDPSKGEADHRWPFFLPDGRHYLFLARDEEPEESSVWIGSLGSSQRKRITQSSGNAAYANGYLFYTREKTLLVQSFDLDKLELTGDPQPLAEELTYNTATAGSEYAVSPAGLLVFAQGSTKVQLKWFDRNGKEVGVVGNIGDFLAPRLSPNGDRLAVTVTGARMDIWIHDLHRATASRFTFKPYDEWSAVWSPDGSQIAFATGPKRPAFDVAIKESQGSGIEQIAWQDPESQRVPQDWSRDGKHLLIGFHNPKRKVINDIWLYSLADGKGTPLVQSQFTEIAGRFSPDGGWFVYTSNESGKSEVYAQAIGRPGKWQISTNGGSWPTWSATGDEIFYVTLDRTLMSVPISTGGGTLKAGDPKALFTLRVAPTAARGFDVSADATRFIVATSTDDSVAPVSVVSNWPALLANRK